MGCCAWKKANKICRFPLKKTKPRIPCGASGIHGAVVFFLERAAELHGAARSAELLAQAFVFLRKEFKHVAGPDVNRQSIAPVHNPDRAARQFPLAGEPAGEHSLDQHHVNGIFIRAGFFIVIVSSLFYFLS